MSSGERYMIRTPPTGVCTRRPLVTMRNERTRKFTTVRGPMAAEIIKAAGMRDRDDKVYADVIRTKEDKLLIREGSISREKDKAT